jgi:hypothetical protein
MNTCVECRWLMFLILCLLLNCSLIYNSWHGLKECTPLFSTILSINRFMYNHYPSATHRCVYTSDIELSNFDSKFLCKLKISKWTHYWIFIAFVIQWLLMHEFHLPKRVPVINSIAWIGYMLEAGNKFPTQAETVFLLSSIQGDHWVHPHCLLMGIFAMSWITVPAGGGQHPLTHLCCYY